MSHEPRVLHMFDAAGVAAALVARARARRLPWRYFPRLRERFERPFRGDFVAWAAWRTAAVARADVLHVHFGDRARWAQKWPHRPYVLHLHGTDIRQLHGMPEFHDDIQRGIDGAAAVFYATADLGEKARAARADATYLPNPVDVSALPAWAPAARPRVIFASRWDESKGLADQLRIARSLRDLGPDVEALGLDWGPGAEAAREAGVTLVPTMPPSAYVRWLASAHVAIGQSAGVLAISELQALAIGVPVVMPAPHPAYDRPPVVAAAPDAVAAACADVLADPSAASQGLGGPAWVSQHHDPDTAVDRLRDTYRKVLETADQR